MVQRTLLIERSPGETRAALLADDATIQIDHFRDRAPPLDGALFHGRVRRIEPGINAAFVDLDDRREGFLRARGVAGRPKGAAIATLVQEGAAILVRVRGEAPDDGSKLPRLVTLDQDVLRDLAPGAVLPAAPACIDAGPPTIDRILGEHAAVGRIVCNDGAVLQQVRRWLAANGGDTVVAQQSGDLFEPFGVEAAIDEALQPRYAVPGGGSLIFEAGETLCAIDVNSGDRIAAAGRAGYDANLAAVPEIARQLRLREIAGAIVIDFVRFRGAAERAALLVALREALADDPSPCRVLGLSRLGLVEMTRERRRPSLAVRLLGPAATPALRPDALAYAILRDLAGRSRRGGGRFVLRVAPVIVDLLQGSLAEALAESVSWSHAGIALTPDPTMAGHDYAIEEGAVPAG